jgi:copper chaperone
MLPSIPLGGIMVNPPDREDPTVSVDELSYVVRGMGCDACRQAITRSVSAVAGAVAVVVDLEAGTVLVRGDGLADAAVRAAIDEAGYDVE